MIHRSRHLAAIERLLAEAPVVALVGARQVGKSTLARAVGESLPSTFFDLESAADLARLAEPGVALGKLRGLVVLDEIHRRPDLFPTLRVLADRPRRPATFLVLGSASPELLRQGSETLAGRIAFHGLPGFALDEVGSSALEPLWVRGGFPASFTAPSGAASARWREDFVSTFLERDLPGFGMRTPAPTMRRFWSMLAHWHGQVWNAAELARSMGTTEKTVGRYLDTLAATFVVRVLRPWHENLAKRQVKAPKVYVADSGLLHSLLGLATVEDVESHPKLGASWEGFALDQIVQRLDARPHECFFWGLHSGAELDLLVVRGRHRLGYEVKRTDAPKVTPSMRSALDALKLDSLTVVHAGAESFDLTERVRAVAATDTWREVAWPAPPARGRAPRRSRAPDTGER